jgi:hypothetical protein
MRNRRWGLPIHVFVSNQMVIYAHMFALPHTAPRIVFYLHYSEVSLLATYEGKEEGCDIPQLLQILCFLIISCLQTFHSQLYL